jgi:hypothetical protein
MTLALGQSDPLGLNHHIGRHATIKGVIRAEAQIQLCRTGGYQTRVVGCFDSLRSLELNWHIDEDTLRIRRNVTHAIQHS